MVIYRAGEVREEDEAAEDAARHFDQGKFFHAAVLRTAHAQVDRLSRSKGTELGDTFHHQRHNIGNAFLLK